LTLLFHYLILILLRTLTKIKEKKIMKAIVSKNAPGAIGPYSQATDNGQIIFVSGQLPIDPKTGEFAGNDIKAQTRQSLENIKAILNEAGLDMSNVMKSTVYLKNIADFGAMNEVYSEFFKEPYPARAAFQVGALPKDALVEIEVVVSR